MTDLSPEKQAKIEKAYSLSPVWFLPFIAALLGIWVLSQNIMHANEEIEIHFENAEGIILDKTKIRYKGVIVGTVKNIEFNSQSGVDIIAEIESQATFMLREKTNFWLVSPKASLTAISGLDTLFSGSYINLQLGEGESSTVFNALSEPPISIPDNALLINLTSDSADAISVGTPLFFKKIKVGEVALLRLDKSGERINIKAFVDSKYGHLVKEDSLFWNISGLNANISRTGIDLKLDSITALIAGGITFSSPSASRAMTKNAQFELYENIDKTESGLAVELTLNNITNLPAGAGILFKGHGIGRITDISYSIEKKHFVANAIINPQFSEMITEGAQFWLEKTSISFSNIENLGNLISGDYIAFLPANADSKNKAKKTHFVVQQVQPAPAPTLSMVLLSEDATGLSPSAPISYQGIKIGEIKQLDFSENGQFIEIVININHDYRYLINNNSQFYLLNGINFKASVKGFEIQSAPLEHLVSGGIALYNLTPVKKSTAQSAIGKNQRFRLYPSKEMAKIGKNAFTSPLLVTLLSKQLPSVGEGSPVYYHKLPIGEVASFSLDDSGLMRTTLSIKGQYKHLIQPNSIFWDISGFNVSAGLSGINIQAESLMAIASGGIAVDIAAESASNKYANGLYKLFDSYQQATQSLTSIIIVFNQAYDLKIGSQLKLKGLPIGEIKALNLTGDNNKVAARAELRAPFAKLVARKGSRFRIVNSELSLTGAKNLSSLVTGAYLNVIAGKGKSENRFIGEAMQDVDNIGLPIILLADNAGSTDINSPVYHRQIQIGEVISKQLSKDASGVEITLNIHPQYTHLIRKNSIFWPASGFNLNFGINGASLKSTSLTSLIKGGISMSTPDYQALQPISPKYTRFALEKEMKNIWLNWKLAIPRS